MDPKMEASTDYGAKHAKSFCRCGHTGDGVNSRHGGLLGHRACLALGCDCVQFTWNRWTPQYRAHMKAMGYAVK